MVEDTPKNPFQGLSDDCRKKMMNNLLKACCKNFGKNADGEDEDCSHDDIKPEDKKDEKKDKPAVVFKDPNLMKIGEGGGLGPVLRWVKNKMRMLRTFEFKVEWKSQIQNIGF